MGKFKNDKSDARTYYENWSKQKNFSPTLKQEIHITRKGWDHLISGSKSRKRNVRDKHRRLNLLKQARYVILNAKSFKQEVRGEGTFYILELKPPGQKYKVKVIIKKDKLGKYFFYSVM